MLEYCCYCETELNKENITWEHLIPKSKQGNSSILNKVRCCRDCNQARGNKEYKLFKSKLENRLINLTNPILIKTCETIIRNVEKWSKYVKDNRSNLVTPNNKPITAKSKPGLTKPIIGTYAPVDTLPGLKVVDKIVIVPKVKKRIIVPSKLIKCSDKNIKVEERLIKPKILTTEEFMAKLKNKFPFAYNQIGETMLPWIYDNLVKKRYE